MADKIIYLAEARNGPPAIPARLESPSGNVADSLGRPLHDLRISVTDRCNFRCVYCMPKEVFDKNHVYLPHTDLLSFEEITRIARLFVAHGVEKIRLTGGEPLLRKNIEKLIAMLAELRTPSGQPLDLTLTTNGSLLARKAQALEGCGPEPSHRLARLARRRHLQAHERCRLRRGRRAGRHRLRRMRRAWDRSRSTWSSRPA